MRGMDGAGQTGVAGLAGRGVPGFGGDWRQPPGQASGGTGGRRRAHARPQTADMNGGCRGCSSACHCLPLLAIDGEGRQPGVSMEVRIGSAGGGKRGGMPSWRVFGVTMLSCRCQTFTNRAREGPQPGWRGCRPGCPGWQPCSADTIIHSHSPQSTVQSNVVRTPRCEPCR